MTLTAFNPTLQQVVNSTSETNVITQTISANTVSAHDHFNLVAWMEYLNNSGSSQNLTTRIHIGGQSGNLKLNGSLGSSAQVSKEIQSLLVVFTGSDLSNMTATVWPAAVQGFNGVGFASTLLTLTGIDTTANFDIAVSAQFANANANLSCECKSAKLTQTGSGSV